MSCGCCAVGESLWPDRRPKRRPRAGRLTRSLSSRSVRYHGESSDVRLACRQHSHMKPLARHHPRLPKGPIDHLIIPTTDEQRTCFCAAPKPLAPFLLAQCCRARFCSAYLLQAWAHYSQTIANLYTERMSSVRAFLVCPICSVRVIWRLRYGSCRQIDRIARSIPRSGQGNAKLHRRRILF